MRTNFFSPHKVIFSRDFYLLWQYLPVCMHACLTLSSAVCAIVFTNLDTKPIRTWKQFIFQWHLCRHRYVFTILPPHRCEKRADFSEIIECNTVFYEIVCASTRRIMAQFIRSFCGMIFFVPALKYVDKHNDVDMALKWSWIDEKRPTEKERVRKKCLFFMRKPYKDRYHGYLLRFSCLLLMVSTTFCT